MIYAGHVHVLKSLIKMGRTPYMRFKSRVNPWVSSEYFDKQMSYLSDLGYISYSKMGTICITESGKETIYSNRKWARDYF